MLFNRITASVPIVLATFLSATAAQPHLQRRGLPGAVYTCTETNFRGQCAWSAPTTQCRQQGPSGLGIQSLGPDPGSLCILYENFDCSGSEVQQVRYPGIQVQMPAFGAFRCSTDGAAVAENSKDRRIDPNADPRLAGGVGSLERKSHLEAIQAMEADGFKEGLIGAKRGVYY